MSLSAHLPSCGCCRGPASYARARERAVASAAARASESSAGTERAARLAAAATATVATVDAATAGGGRQSVMKMVGVSACAARARRTGRRLLGFCRVSHGSQELQRLARGERLHRACILHQIHAQAPSQQRQLGAGRRPAGRPKRRGATADQSAADREGRPMRAAGLESTSSPRQRAESRQGAPCTNGTSSEAERSTGPCMGTASRALYIYHADRESTVTQCNLLYMYCTRIDFRCFSAAIKKYAVIMYTYTSIPPAAQRCHRRSSQIISRRQPTTFTQLTSHNTHARCGFTLS